MGNFRLLVLFLAGIFVVGFGASEVFAAEANSSYVHYTADEVGREDQKVIEGNRNIITGTLDTLDSAAWSLLGFFHTLLPPQPEGKVEYRMVLVMSRGNRWERVYPKYDRDRY